MTTEQLPKREGVQVIESDYPRAFFNFGYNSFNISSTYELPDLLTDYMLFTHAALFVHGNWVRDPISDFINEGHSDCKVFWTDLGKPIFSGLSFRDPVTRRFNNDWNYKIFGCQKEFSEELLAYLGSIAGINKVDKRFHVAMIQKIPLYYKPIDKKKTKLTDPLPSIDIFTVGLMGTDRTVYFEPAKNPPIDTIKVKIGPARDEVLELAKAILNQGQQHE